MVKKEIILLLADMFLVHSLNFVVLKTPLHFPLKQLQFVVPLLVGALVLLLRLVLLLLRVLLDRLGVRQQHGLVVPPCEL